MSEVFVVDGKDSENVLEVDQEVSHCLSPTPPASTFLHLHRIDPQIHYLALPCINHERHAKLLRVLDAFRL